MRYEIWNYLQARPISYQKAIKSFRDLEITSAPGWVLPRGMIHPHPATCPFTPRNVSTGGMRAVWATFFPSISSAFLLAAARHRRQEEEALPASSVETRSTETAAAAAAADEDPSSSSSFSFSRDHLDGRFLFSCSKA